MRMPGAGLAELVWDGDVDAGPPPWIVPGRGEDGAEPGRLLCFAGSGIAVALQVAGRVRAAVRGTLMPAVPADLALQSMAGMPAGGLVRPDLDARGGFTCGDVPRGPLRVVVRRPDAAPVVTAWVVVD